MSTAAAQGFEITTAPVTRTQIVRFAGAGGDFNPMHHDEEFARAAGQPSVFAMGQLTAAIVAGAVSAQLGGAERVAGYGIRFKDKVWPGDSLVISAVGESEPGDGADRGEASDRAEVRLELTVRTASDDRTVASGWVRIRT